VAGGNGGKRFARTGLKHTNTALGRGAGNVETGSIGRERQTRG
jgi:hypothetical protein